MSMAETSVDCRAAALRSEIDELQRSVRLMSDELVRESIEGSKQVNRHRGDSCPPMAWVGSVQSTVTILADLDQAIRALQCELDAVQAEALFHAESR